MDSKRSRSRSGSRRGSRSRSRSGSRSPKRAREAAREEPFVAEERLEEPLTLTSDVAHRTVASHVSEGGRFGNNGFKSLNQFLDPLSQARLGSVNVEMRRVYKGYQDRLERERHQRLQGHQTRNSFFKISFDVDENLGGRCEGEMISYNKTVFVKWPTKVLHNASQQQEELKEVLFEILQTPVIQTILNNPLNMQISAYGKNEIKIIKRTLSNAAKNKLLEMFYDLLSKKPTQNQITTGYKVVSRFQEKRSDNCNNFFNLVFSQIDPAFEPNLDHYGYYSNVEVYDQA